MKKFKSTQFNSSEIPNSSLIYDELIYQGYYGFIAHSFLSDLFIVSKDIMLNKNSYDTDYYLLIKSIFKNSILYWISDTISVYIDIASKYDLRVLESGSVKGLIQTLNDIPFSYNYNFKLSDISESNVQLLNITDDELNGIKRLPEDIIDVLTLANNIGSFRKTTKMFTTKNSTMKSFGDVVRIPKFKIADPLFSYKFSIKSYDIIEDSSTFRMSNNMVFGYFFNNKITATDISMLLKLLGVIILNDFSENYTLRIYSFYMDTYSKKDFDNVNDIITYFSSPKQLKLFPINNTKALNTMLHENKNSDIVFIPNSEALCTVDNSYTQASTVNIISTKTSKFNMYYSNICKKTSGKLIMI